MKLKQRYAPHIRHHESNRTLMSDVIILLLVLTVLAFLFYGPRAVLVCGITALTSVLCDAVCVLLRGKRLNPRDFSPIVTGLLIALAMPATVPFHVVIVAAVFAIAIVKHPFGGTGHNPFNPAAAGFSFAAICWPMEVFTYPMPFDQIPVWGKFSEGAFLYQDTVLRLTQNLSPAHVLKTGGVPQLKPVEMLLGNFSGPMGATNILVILTCLLYLLLRHTVRWQLPVSFFASCAFIIFLFPRSGMDGIHAIYYEMMSGILLYAAVFMLTDPTTSPTRDSSVVVYGVFAGIITMLFRYYSESIFEESVSFSILLANAFVPFIDRYNESLHRLIRRKRREAKKNPNASEA